MRVTSLLILFLSFQSAQGQVQNKYNELYTQMLFEKQQWPNQLSAQKSRVDLSQSNYQNAIDTLMTSQLNLQRQQADLETQEQHLAFLKRIEPLSLKEKEKIKGNVVSLGEFSLPSQVSLLSLEQKGIELKQEADDKQKEIDGNQAKISELINSSEYKGYLFRRNQLRSDKSKKERDLDQVQRTIVNLRSVINSLRFQLQNSEQREEAARIRMVRIQQEIPNLHREIRDLRRDIQNIRQDIQQKVQTRQEIENRRDQTKQQIQHKENQMNQEGADLQALQAEINQLKNQLQQQNQRINQLTNNIQNLHIEVDRRQVQINRNEQEIARLENEQRQQEAIVADEEIRQIRIEGDIRDNQRQISSLEIEQSNLQVQINSINSQLTTVQSQISQFDITFIRPIELTISQLSKQKSNLSNRLKLLMQARQGLLTQDQNIVISKEKIPLQVALIQQKKEGVLAMQLEIGQLQNQSKIVETTLKKEIESYNGLIASIQKRKDQLKLLQQQVIDEIQLKKNGGN